MNVAQFPPRGVARGGVKEQAPRALWGDPAQLDSSWDYQTNAHRAVLLGKSGERLIGRADDRHIVTIAGSRAGKSQTVLIPNLKRYRGPVVVIDPKGELALETASIRERMGHKVVILNPFNVMNWGTHRHNPLAELLNSPQETVAADVAQFADSSIIDNAKDPHWTDSGKNFTGLDIGHTLTTKPEELSMPLLRRHLSDTLSMPARLEAMSLNEALDGSIRNAALSFLSKFHRVGKSWEPSEEMRSILSTVNTQTRAFDDLKAVFDGHDFSLEELSGQRPVTVYLILPAMRIPTHSRWLRLFVNQLLATMERNPIGRERLPLLLILEEFAALGHMRSIEAAAGYFAGFGVKLWTILQDLTQIKTHYPNSWETFLGNAGVIQAFGNFDVTTTKYLSDLLGQTTITEEQRSFVSAEQRAHGDEGIRHNLRTVPLLAPFEVTQAFARERMNQLVLVPGERPVFLSRLPIEE